MHPLCSVRMHAAVLGVGVSPFRILPPLCGRPNLEVFSTPGDSRGARSGPHPKTIRKQQYSGAACHSWVCAVLLTKGSGYFVPDAYYTYWLLTFPRGWTRRRTQGKYWSEHRGMAVRLISTYTGVLSDRPWVLPSRHPGKVVKRGQGITSRTLKTLIPKSCGPTKRNSNNSSLFCPTNWVRWFTESKIPAIQTSYYLIHKKAHFLIVLTNIIFNVQFFDVLCIFASFYILLNLYIN